MCVSSELVHVLFTLFLWKKISHVIPFRLCIHSFILGKGTDDYPKLEMPSGNSLLELLDSVVLLYHIAAHKQLGKVFVMICLSSERCYLISECCYFCSTCVSCADLSSEGQTQNWGMGRNSFYWAWQKSHLVDWT